MYVWDGRSYAQSDKLYNGKSCTCIAPEVITGVDDQLFGFDKQLMLDIGVTLQCSSTHEPPSDVPSKGKESRKCKVCHKLVPLNNMRVHVGAHILRHPERFSPSTCGFCCKSTCTVNLKATSRSKGIQKEKTNSNCEYQKNFNLESAKTVSKRMPCCNRPI